VNAPINGPASYDGRGQGSTKIKIGGHPLFKRFLDSPKVLGSEERSPEGEVTFQMFGQYLEEILQLGGNIRGVVRRLTEPPDPDVAKPRPAPGRLRRSARMSTTAIGTYKVGTGGGEVVRTGTTSNQTQRKKIGPRKGSLNESFKGIKIFGF